MPFLIDDRYEVIRKLGRGGMGTVYLVNDPAFQRQVALKTLNRPLAAGSGLTRFKTEFQATSHLNHPHVIQVYDFGVTKEGTPYFTMEYVEGKPLSDQVESLTTEARARVISHLCLALGFIHEKGLVHGDLKPSNVLLRPNGSAVLMDFGLVENVHAPGERLVKGTVGFIAPEVFRGELSDARADLYALGATWYVLATGHPPFQGKQVSDIIRQQLLGEFTAPGSQNPDLAAEEEKVILRLLQADPALRLQSADEVREALQPLLPPEDSVVLKAHVRSYVASTHCVGRKGLLEEAAALARKALSGQGPAFLALSGEEGIGKSRVLREVERTLQLEGYWCLRSEREAASRSPYGAFLRAFRLMLPRWETLNDPSMETSGAALRALFPDLPDGLEVRIPQEPPENLDAEERRTWFQNALASLLAALAVQQPFCLIFDDLQDTDAYSWQLFHRLLEVLDGQPKAKGVPRCMFMATMGPGFQGGGTVSSGQQTLEEWQRNYPWVHLREVGRLSDTALGELVEAVFGQMDDAALLARKLQDETEGNPFFAEEILKDLVERKVIVREAAQWKVDRQAFDQTQLPASLAEALTQRLQRLTPDLAAALRGAALFRHPWTVEWLAGVLEVSEGEVYRRCNLLLETRYLRQVRGQGTAAYMFSKRQVRDVLLLRWSQEERREAASRIGRLLDQARREDLPEPEGVLYEYAVEAGEWDRATRFAEESALRAEKLFALDEAVAAYQRALDALAHLDSRESQEKHLELLNIQGSLHYSLGHLDQAYLNCERMIPLAEALGSDLGRAKALGNLGFLSEKLGRKERAIEHYQAGLALAESLSNPWLTARMRTNLGFVVMGKGELAQAREHFLAAKTLALQENDEQLLVTLHLNLGYVAGLIGYRQERAEDLKEGLALARKLGQEDQAAKFLAEQGIDLRQTGRPAESLPILEEALEKARQARSAQKEALVLNHLARTCLLLGHVERAEECLDQARAITQESGLLREGCETFCFLGHLLLTRGRLSEALQTVEEAYDAAITSEDKELEIEVALLLALLAAEGVVMQSPLPYLGALLDLVRTQGYASYEAGLLLARGAVEMAQKDLNGARATVDEAEQAILRCGDVLDSWGASLLRATLFLELRRSKEALPLLESLIGEAIQAGTVLLEAEARYLISRYQIIEETSGTNSLEQEVRAHLDRALEIALGTGSEGLEWKVQAALAALEMRLGNSRAAWSHSLRSEVLLRALDSSFTNRDLAARWSSSPLIQEQRERHSSLLLDSQPWSHPDLPTADLAREQAALAEDGPLVLSDLLNDEVSRRIVEAAQLYRTQSAKAKSPWHSWFPAAGGVFFPSPVALSWHFQFQAAGIEPGWVTALVKPPFGVLVFSFGKDGDDGLPAWRGALTGILAGTPPEDWEHQVRALIKASPDRLQGSPWLGVFDLSKPAAVWLAPGLSLRVEEMEPGLWQIRQEQESMPPPGSPGEAFPPLEGDSPFPVSGRTTSEGVPLIWYRWKPILNSKLPRRQ